MKSHCASSTCRFRKFGIGGDFQHEMSDLTKYQSDESQWFLNIEWTSFIIKHKRFV